MKIVLFRDGRPGVVAKLPGDNPNVELTDLLGGEIRMEAVSRNLAVVRLKNGEELGLPHCYNIRRLGRSMTPVYGDCALVALTIEGPYRDVNVQEIAAAEGYVYAAERDDA